jgi:ABC-type lipoprotein export system ATPase subunit
MSEPVLAVEKLVRHYERGAVRALNGISFEARAGEVVTVTGPSGCGKSTLLSLIGLLDRPTSGRVRIGGVDLGGIARPAMFRARRLGFVFQFHHLVPTMTLAENVAAPMVALGVGRRLRKLRAQALLGQVDLVHRADFLPSRVSGGERQRAAVARALSNEPPIILADEPTGNLDSRNGAAVVDLLLKHARREGALVIIATHNPEIARLGDRHLALLDGEEVPA